MKTVTIMLGKLLFIAPSFNFGIPCTCSAVHALFNPSSISPMCPLVPGKQGLQLARQLRLHVHCMAVYVRTCAIYTEWLPVISTNLMTQADKIRMMHTASLAQVQWTSYDLEPSDLLTLIFMGVLHCYYEFPMKCSPIALNGENVLQDKNLPIFSTMPGHSKRQQLAKFVKSFSLVCFVEKSRAFSQQCWQDQVPSEALKKENLSSFHVHMRNLLHSYLFPFEKYPAMQYV